MAYQVKIMPQADEELEELARTKEACHC